MAHPITRRCVFYVAGFDPSGPAQHHRLYTQEADKQAALKGYTISVGARKNTSEHLAQWSVEHRSAEPLDSPPTHTDYVFARWDDIVRAHWGKLDSWAHVLQFAISFFATQWYYLRTGALWAMLRLAWPPVVALVAPLALLLGSACVWLVAVSAAWGSIAWTLGVGTLSGLGLWLLIQRLEAKFHMLWLMRSYMFTRLCAMGRVPAVDERLQVFAAAIAQARASGQYDEVLVVGHSSGCILAASAAARSLALMAKASAAPVAPLGLVTLGHCIPLLSSLPAAQSCRDDLKAIAESGTVRWIDFTAPSDGSCFAFVDSIAAAWPGLSNSQGQSASTPTLLSPRFQTLMSPEQYRALCKNRFDLHFQYIHGGSIAGEYDFYALTSGPLSLVERFADAHSVTDFTKFRLFG
jgi:pimeloyl-ACP methyl ester carboxylesterase